VRGLLDEIKYDGSSRDRTEAIEAFYQDSAWDLAEDLYDARVLVRRLLADMVGAEPKGLPYWATR
jgi:hypothetical protein